MATLLGDSHPGFPQIYPGVRWHLGGIYYPFGVQIGPKLAVPPIEGVAGQQFKRQAAGLGPFEHLQTQLELGLKVPLFREAQCLAYLSQVFPKPGLRQEHLTIDQGPEPMLALA
jgi:hypothetical protein